MRTSRCSPVLLPPHRTLLGRPHRHTGRRSGQVPTAPLGSWACLKPQLPRPSASGDRDGHVLPPGGRRCPEPARGSVLPSPREGAARPTAHTAGPEGTKPTPPTSMT